MALQGKVHTLKTYTPFIYKWSAPPTTKLTGVGPIGNPTYCNARSYSQGQDWVTTYVYNQIVVGIQVERIAYVECDYVQ